MRGGRLLNALLGKMNCAYCPYRLYIYRPFVVEQIVSYQD